MFGRERGQGTVRFFRQGKVLNDFPFGKFKEISTTGGGFDGTSRSHARTSLAFPFPVRIPVCLRGLGKQPVAEIAARRRNFPHMFGHAVRIGGVFVQNAKRAQQFAGLIRQLTESPGVVYTKPLRLERRPALAADDFKNFVGSAVVNSDFTDNVHDGSTCTTKWLSENGA